MLKIIPQNVNMISLKILKFFWKIPENFEKFPNSSKFSKIPKFFKNLKPSEKCPNSGKITYVRNVSSSKKVLQKIKKIFENYSKKDKF